MYAMCVCIVLYCMCVLYVCIFLYILLLFLNVLCMNSIAQKYVYVWKYVYVCTCMQKCVRYIILYACICMLFSSYNIN